MTATVSPKDLNTETDKQRFINTINLGLEQARPGSPDGFWQSCIEHAEVFHKAFEFGRVRGIVFIAGENLPLAEELIKRDILVTTSGRPAPDTDLSEEAGAGLTDVCDFIEIEPVIHLNTPNDSSAMLEFYKLQTDMTSTAVCDLPLTAITSDSSPDLSNLQHVCGTVFSIKNDPIETADLLEEHIHIKRLKLGWHDRFYCSDAAYS